MRSAYRWISEMRIFSQKYGINDNKAPVTSISDEPRAKKNIDGKHSPQIIRRVCTM